MSTSLPPPDGLVNGIDTRSLRRLAEGVAADAAAGRLRFEVETAWKGGTRSDSRVASWHFGGRRLSSDFTMRCDEPCELLGAGTAPNPQEMLLAAFNACMAVGYAAGCAMQGIELRSLSIRTEGELDLRGFLGLDESIPVGWTTLRTTVTLRADGSEEALRAIHANVLRSSPNRFHLGQRVELEGELVLE